MVAGWLAGWPGPAGLAGAGLVAAWLGGWLAGWWLVGWLVCWPACWPAGWLAGWWLAGWLPWWLAGLLAGGWLAGWLKRGPFHLNRKGVVGDIRGWAPPPSSFQVRLGAACGVTAATAAAAAAAAAAGVTACCSTNAQLSTSGGDAVRGSDHGSHANPDIGKW